MHKKLHYMCYDISFTVSIEKVSDYLPGLIIDPDMDIDPELHMHVQAQAYRKFPVIILEDGRYKLKQFEWCVIPPYMNTPEKIKKGRSFMCNAQSEKVLDKKTYWGKISKNRCVVPVTGIYEHREIKGWKNKVPYLVKLRNRNVFCLPGLYSYAPVPDPETGEVRVTYTIITRGANEVMEHIHNGGDNRGRMPLFLTRELELQWLEPDLTNPDIQHILDYEMPSEQMEYWPVHTIRTTRERPDHKKKYEPFKWPGLPPLGVDDPVEQPGLF